mmetsp:Transcript_171393/g.549402  ORF Transcript_171393/g.549402 Transcript_171393/m.549402 type:complete len:109 (-) Transcript_171393:6-332(-)
MARNSSLMLTLALAACAVYFLIPAQESFVAPSPAVSSLRAGSSLAQGYAFEARDAQVSMAAQTQSENQGITSPRKINLLFIALLAGTAAIGLLALFFYGSYSGTGSSV